MGGEQHRYEFFLFRCVRRGLFVGGLLEGGVVWEVWFLEMVREGTALVATKWVGLAAAIWVQASAGNAYMFAFYSPSLKAVLHYNQLQLNNLGVAKDFGENVGLIAGLLCNKLPAWILLCTGALFGCLGYGTLWLVVSEQIGPLPYWQVCTTFPLLPIFQAHIITIVCVCFLFLRPKFCKMVIELTLFPKLTSITIFKKPL